VKIFTCEICCKEFKRGGLNPKARFCSFACKAEFQHRYNTGENHPRWNKDYSQHCGKEFTSDNPTTLQRMKFCSKKCADIGGLRYKGKDHPNWRGIKSEVNRLRGQAKYKKWSRDIMERDNFTCQICGKRGGTLNAHHLLSFTDYAEYRYEMWNGVTVCRKCHAKLHRPKVGSKFQGTIENGVNSVKLPMGQYRAEPEKEGVEAASQKR